MRAHKMYVNISHACFCCLADLIGNDVARVCDVDPHTQAIAGPDRAGIELQILVLEACVAARVRAHGDITSVGKSEPCMGYR